MAIWIKEEGWLTNRSRHPWVGVSF